MLLLAGAAIAVFGGRKLARPPSKPPQVSAGLDAAWPKVLGGFRGLAANVAWLRVQLAWERGDEAAVERWSDLATAFEPEAVMFWVNTARMLAFDFADAKEATAARTEGEWETRRRSIDRAQAARALERLERARLACGDDPRLWIEMGSIHLHRRKDLAQAAECFANAANSARAPLYARRIEAGLRWQLGQRKAAYASLRLHQDELMAAAGAGDEGLEQLVKQRLELWARELEHVSP